MNLVTDVFPALALAVEPPTPGIMKRPPRPPQSVLLSNRFLLLIGWQGVMLAAITLSIYAWAINTYGEGAHSRTLTLMTLISVQLGHMFNCRSRTQSAFEGLLRNPFIWVAAAIVILLQMLAIYLKPLAHVLDTVELTGRDWLLAGVAVLAPIVIVEITKFASRKRRQTL
jgi:Ca2+-transporting ATPase